MKKKITPEEQLTIEFHSLNYSSKLEFWEKNKLDFYNMHHSFRTRERGETEEEEEKRDKNVSISIKPNTPEEGREYFQWRKNHLVKQWTEKYFATLNKKDTNSKRKEFIESEIERMKLLLNPKPNYKSDVTISFDSAILTGYNAEKNEEGIILDRVNRPFWQNYIKGASIYVFKHFLEQQDDNSNPPEENDFLTFMSFITGAINTLRNWKENIQGKRIVNWERFSDSFDKADIAVTSYLRSSTSIEQQNFYLSKILKECDYVNEEFEKEIKPNINLINGRILFEINQTVYKFREMFAEKYSTNPLEILKETEPQKKLSHKQQILLLEHLGFFSITKIENLTTEKKGELIGALINKDSKNTSDYIRYKGGVKVDKKFNCRTEENIKTVNNILRNVGFTEEELIKLKLF